jgi:hypothetical protein
VATSALKFLAHELWKDAADIYSKLLIEKPSGFVMPQTEQLFEFID